MKRTAAIALIAALAACIGNNGDAGTLTPTVEENSHDTPIAEIQGSAAASTMSGQTVTIEGVVSGDFQDNDADTGRNLGGFYVQQPDDDNAETSDGVFVFDGSDPQTAVNPGDLVRVTGVIEQNLSCRDIVALRRKASDVGRVVVRKLNLSAAFDQQDFTRSLETV